MGSKILIVEDEVIVAEDLKWTLRSSGFDVTGIARTGSEALEKTLETQPDVVVMDLHLQGILQGLEVVEQIETNYTHIPKFVFVTGLNVADAAMIENGRYRLLRKPYLANEVVTAIRQLIDAKGDGM